jgi:hypothetical protein
MSITINSGLGSHSNTILMNHKGTYIDCICSSEVTIVLMQQVEKRNQVMDELLFQMQHSRTKKELKTLVAELSDCHKANERDIEQHNKLLT